jgi:acetylornithine deacetylase/succinyl-diaminopimelate desuccinylase-like protein
MTDFARLDQTVLDQLDAHLEELSALCAQPSIAAQDEGMRACAELVASMLARRGFEVEILPTGGQPAVVAERKGRTSKRLLLYNHYDVQPPEPLDLWQTPPFEPSLRDGKLYARGVSDDKGHILCRLAAIDALLEQSDELPCTIKFVIEGEEEIGSPNLDGFVKEHRRRLAADACLWEFGGVDHEGRPVMYAGLRGIVYVELRSRTGTLDAHSGLGGSIFPNAAWRLTWALASLKGPDERIRLPGFYDAVQSPSERDLALLAQLPDDSADLLERYGLPGFIKGLQGGLAFEREKIFSPTCTICGLTAGYQGPGSKTVLPAEASAKVDFRLVPDQQPAQVLAQLRKHLADEGFTDIEVVDLGSEPPGRSDPDHPFLRLAIDSAQDVYGQTQLVQPMSGGSGPIHPFLEYLGVPVATAGVSYPGARVHAPDENMVLDNFVNGVRHTARIIDGFGQGDFGSG